MDYDSTPEFDDPFLKLTRKNKALEARFIKNRVQFLYIDHHDLVYEKSAEILEEIEREED